MIGEIAPNVQLRGVAWVQNCTRGEMLIKKKVFYRADEIIFHEIFSGFFKNFCEIFLTKMQEKIQPVPGFSSDQGSKMRFGPPKTRFQNRGSLRSEPTYPRVH
jgi:hypothetical protein